MTIRTAVVVLEDKKLAWSRCSDEWKVGLGEERRAFAKARRVGAHAPTNDSSRLCVP